MSKEEMFKINVIVKCMVTILFGCRVYETFELKPRGSCRDLGIYGI
jgi:hypothetical protein